MSMQLQKKALNGLKNNEVDVVAVTGCGIVVVAAAGDAIVDAEVINIASVKIVAADMIGLLYFFLSSRCIISLLKHECGE